jgi:hypothetical protein
MKLHYVKGKNMDNTDIMFIAQFCTIPLAAILGTVLSSLFRFGLISQNEKDYMKIPKYVIVAIICVILITICIYINHVHNMSIT